MRSRMAVPALICVVVIATHDMHRVFAEPFARRPNPGEQHNLIDKPQLQSVLDSMPTWRPDNSFFQGGLDEQTRERRVRMAELTEK